MLLETYFSSNQLKKLRKKSMQKKHMVLLFKCALLSSKDYFFISSEGLLSLLSTFIVETL